MAPSQRSDNTGQSVLGLYPIIDLDTVDRTRFSALAVALRVLEARPKILQLRAKHASALRTLGLLRELLPHCRQRGALLFANDRLDLAELAGVDGVHVGQDDLSIAAVRRLAPGLRVGVSTHSLAELEQALACKPDYAAFGPVFPTPSKLNPDPVVGLDQLAIAADRARACGIPLVAIGGINGTRAPLIRELGVCGAVIGGLIEPSLPAIEARALALHSALGG